jgi:hypothetical protein
VISAKERKRATRLGKVFDDALARATMKVRSCGQLIGLDKIRADIAWKAALKATGFEANEPYQMPGDLGEVTQDILDVVYPLFEQALEAARPPTPKGD